MSETNYEEDDRSFDEAAVIKVATMIAAFYLTLLGHGVREPAAVEIVRAWIAATFTSGVRNVGDS